MGSSFLTDIIGEDLAMFSVSVLPLIIVATVVTIWQKRRDK